MFTCSVREVVGPDYWRRLSESAGMPQRLYRRSIQRLVQLFELACAFALDSKGRVLSMRCRRAGPTTNNRFDSDSLQETSVGEMALLGDYVLVIINLVNALLLIDFGACRIVDVPGHL